MILNPSDLPLQELHQILLTAVAPRPICFASTVDNNGRVNLSPFSYFNVFSANPPVLIFSPARSGRDNTTKNTHDNVKEVAEVCINIVNHSMVTQMSLASTAYEKGVNEFEKAGFTEVQSELIKPPRVGEAPVSFECKVNDVIELAHLPGAGNLVICEILKIHLNEAFLSDGLLDTQKLDLVGRMGGNWYVRASGDALFEIPKPIQTKGIGVDALPKSIRNSNILTGNHLGILGNQESLPATDAVQYIVHDEEVLMLSKKISNLPPATQLEQYHWHAKSLIEENEVNKAMALLMYVDQTIAQ